MRKGFDNIQIDLKFAGGDVNFICFEPEQSLEDSRRKPFAAVLEFAIIAQCEVDICIEKTNDSVTIVSQPLNQGFQGFRPCPVL